MDINTLSRQIKGAVYLPNRWWKKTSRRIKLFSQKTYPGLNGRLHPKDAMFHGVEHYIQVGQDAVRNIEQALRIANRSWHDLNEVLDIPSGHGRVLRQLVEKMP